MIIDAKQGLVIDGTWNGFAEDSGVPSQGGEAYANLLCESRRAPEMVIVLKCKEQAAFDRLIDSDKTKAEYDKLMAERAAGKKKQREEDRATKQQETEDGLKDDEEKTPDQKADEVKQAMIEWDEARDTQDAEDEENDADKPNLEEMMEKHKETIRTQRETDEGFLEEFSNILKEKGILVIDDIKSDTSADFVYIKLNSRFGNNF
jgi:hypothetical protein